MPAITVVACKGYQSCLERITAEHPELCRQVGLTKQDILRLAVGARDAVET